MPEAVYPSFRSQESWESVVDRFGNALVQLASEGLIAHEPGSGSFVRRPQRDDLEDLFEFREWVKARAAKEAARRKISREVAARIQDACDAARKFAKVIKEAESESFDDDLKQQWFACEANFHLNIIHIVGNRLLNRPRCRWLRRPGRSFGTIPVDS